MRKLLILCLAIFCIPLFISSCLSVPARDYRTEASAASASRELPDSGTIIGGESRSGGTTEKSTKPEINAGSIGAEDKEGDSPALTRPQQDVSAYHARPIEEKAVNVPSKLMNAVFESPQIYIGELVKFLIEDETDPFLQVKLIHDWIADNIAYDTAAYFSGNISSQAWALTLKNRKSVCEGYAGLFEKMCGLAGISCVKISGHARGYGFSLFEDENLKESNHAWNAVEIQDSWYLVDCTWDAGYIEGAEFLKHYSTAYLFLEPEAMIYTHFPENPKWQLLSRPIDASTIAEEPNYRGRYFLMGLRPIENLKKLNYTGSSFQFSFPAPQDIIFTSRLKSEDGRTAENASLVHYRENTAEVLVTFPAPGRWELQLFAKKLSETGQYRFIISIGFIAESGSIELLPLTYQSFSEDRCYIYSPRYGGLPIGKEIEFRLILPGYTEAYVSCGLKRFPLTAGDNFLFHGRVHLTEKNDIMIFASKDSPAKTYTGIAGYAPAD